MRELSVGQLPATTWPTPRLGEAIERLVEGGGLPCSRATAPDGGGGRPPDDRIERARWLARWAEAAGLELVRQESSDADLPTMLEAAAPALLPVSLPDRAAWIALLRVHRGRAVLARPDAEPIAISLSDLVRWLRAPRHVEHGAEVESLLSAVGVGGPRRSVARRSLLHWRAASERGCKCLALRVRATASIPRQLWGAAIGWRLAAIVLVQALEHAAMIGAWVVLGAAAFGGALDLGRLLGWVLLLASTVPLRWLGHWCQGAFAVDLGRALKRRLLGGALELDQDEVRRQGSGELLGRVIETEALETLALDSGMLAITSGIELVAALLVLAAASGLTAVLLAAWLVVLSGLVVGYTRACRRWTEERTTATSELVEQLIGHRTRLVQLPLERAHDGQDSQLKQYLDRARTMDAWSVTLQVLGPRGWLVLGCASVLWPWIRGAADEIALGIGIGGVLLGYRALRGIVAASRAVIGASIAVRSARPMLAAARRHEQRPCPAPQPERPLAPPGAPTLVARDLRFARPGRPQPILDGCSLTLRRGEPAILEGTSGSGKSTLVALLAGLEDPQAGLLMLRGLDRASAGAAGWSGRVAAAPQFHDNHVLGNSLSFNLLMGRCWPPRPADLAEAEELCRALGLGDLLDRMPRGLDQDVGETGWQLSHGERSRVFLARALLQGADVVLLDESFGALDPPTRLRCLEVARQRAPSLLVVAHP